jgi:hypothetical protein
MLTKTLEHDCLKKPSVGLMLHLQIREMPRKAKNRRTKYMVNLHHLITIFKLPMHCKLNITNSKQKTHYPSYCPKSPLTLLFLLSHERCAISK